jgi:hypothetical protein
MFQEKETDRFFPHNQHIMMKLLRHILGKLFIWWITPAQHFLRPSKEGCGR